MDLGGGEVTNNKRPHILYTCMRARRFPSKRFVQKSVQKGHLASGRVGKPGESGRAKGDSGIDIQK
jgi:hypothetical protein